MLANLRDVLHTFSATRRALRLYHLAWAVGSARWYRHPSRRMSVVGITGTKGKTTTTEMLFAILREAGHTTAISNTIRFAVGEREERNLLKMTMPGRGFLQAFLARAAAEGATHAVIEMTSQGADLFRHRGIELDGFIFTMLEPEHIEAHGSFEAYRDAKRALFAESLVASHKPNRFVVANADDSEGEWYLQEREGVRSIPFSLNEVTVEEETATGSVFSYKGHTFRLLLPGRSSIANALAAIKAAEQLGVPLSTAAQALAKLEKIPGRFEFVSLPEWPEQDVAVVVDYAHTPGSLQALYEAFRGEHLVCVLGSCGGGRDRWKRQKMGAIAEAHCNILYLTDEDPYDEDPMQIINDIQQGIKEKRANVLLDRREAITQAVVHAPAGSVVVISGKGSDPFLMGAGGKKIPWSDVAIAREALRVRRQDQRALREVGS